ncbi:MAG: branched-chain amino acid ABC transporter substrate-binding protein [Acidimicrobiaceae bacterium]|nr:branched-chain amino acid ABC transporter substrate-binding protein [Acidimicrobiaceae bacterium]
MTGARRTAKLLAALALLAAGCGGSEGEAAGTVGDGSLGVVRVEAGDAIQIRTMTRLSGPVTDGLTTYHQAAVFAVADYGPIRGFAVELAALDEQCTPEGGEQAARAVVDDAAIVGVVGTSCSAAATGASPVLSAAGLTMISPSNSSPSLTSDLAGNPSEFYRPGYYRTAQNDLYQGEAVASFLRDVIEVDRVAVIHHGDAYTKGLATAFGTAFEATGGSIIGMVEVDRDATDVTGVLARIAAGNPEALFLPVTRPLADYVVEQASTPGALGQAVLVAADTVLNAPFLELEAADGVFVAGPDLRYGDNANQSTGKAADHVIQRFVDETGGPPVRAFWAHSYDAATLLLDAIHAASWLDDGVLVIDRAAIRQHLDQVSGFDGIIGTISCSAFGDCGPANMTIVRSLGPGRGAASLRNVVYEFSPS